MTFINGKFMVMAERCDQCLYSPDKIVTNDRRKDIIKGLALNDGFFVCHKATLLGRAVACRADFDQRECGQAGQVASRLNLLQFVKQEDLLTLPEKELPEHD